jgi:hypothetical protein
MLRVTIEVLPYGVEKDRETVYQLLIGNKGKVTDRSYSESGNLYKYDCTLIDTVNNRQAYLSEVYHLRNMGALPLVEQCLEKLRERLQCGNVEWI